MKAGGIGDTVCTDAPWVVSCVLSTRGYSLVAFYQLYLVTESKRKLLMYLLHKRVSFSMCLLIVFRLSQNASR